MNSSIVKEQPADTPLELTPEQSLEREKRLFQEFVTTADITPDNLKLGWENYLHFTQVRYFSELQNEEQKPNSSSLLSYKSAQYRCKRLGGEKVDSEIQESISRAMFLGDTTGPVYTTGNEGTLLKDLSGEKLTRAREFCLQMNEVGL